MFTFFIQISPSLSLGLPGNQHREERKWNPALFLGEKKIKKERKEKQSKMQPKTVPAPARAKKSEFFIFYIFLQGW